MTSVNNFFYIPRIRAHLGLVEAKGGVFQVRPQKEFVTGRGRSRLLSLPLLSSSLGAGIDDSTSTDGDAYSFGKPDQDPFYAKWAATVRIANFVQADHAPLCVRLDVEMRPSRLNSRRLVLLELFSTIWLVPEPLEDQLTKKIGGARYALLRSSFRQFVLCSALEGGSSMTYRDQYMMVNSDTIQ